MNTRTIIIVVVVAMSMSSVPLGEASDSTKGPLPDEDPRDCRATLSVPHTRGASGCWLDEQVTRNPGLLTYPCDGGPAVARFGGARFTGTVSASGDVDLRLRTQFHYGDGCDWSTVQRIRGRLSNRQLSYAYSEAPLPGQQRCARACRATAVVGVTLHGPVPAPATNTP